MTAIQKATQALAKLSDAEWVRVKSVEDRRRTDQHTVRDLAKCYRELRNQKRSPPA